MAGTAFEESDGFHGSAQMPPEGFDPQQMHQMQAIMNMAATMPPHGVDHGMMMPGSVDPAMLQAYMHMFSYVQQNLQQSAAGFGAPSGVPGLPPMPFPGMASPYDMPTYGALQAPDAGSQGVIQVSVEGMKFQYQLTEDDLQKVFSRYGKVRSIRVDEAGSAASIAFAAVNDAQAAMNDLNGKVLNGLEGTLRISWAASQGGMAPPVMPPPYPSMPFPGWALPSTTGNSPWAANPSMPTPGPTPLPLSGGACGCGSSLVHVSTPPPHVKGVRKYTCRFLIGIDNEKDFQVARRIIGAKGVNMKRIFKQTEAKLRLRGRGSGYFEGAGQKESAEPLQLCISCTSAEGYKSAVRQAEELLKRLYDEYRQYCREANRTPPDLSINFSENQLVYSRSPAPGALPSDVHSDGGGAQLEGEGKEKRRSRRSRNKGRDGKTTGESVERGEPGPNAPDVEEIEKLIDERNEARRACNFAEADRVRELLVSRGVALMDEPGGRGRGTEVTTWRYWRD